jgi:hypothetical protein
MFLAHKGAGAFVAPLPASQAGRKLSASSRPLTPIQVQDAEDMSSARFMESFESRHSDHSFTAAVVSAWRRGRTCVQWLLSTGSHTATTCRVLL